jgi:uncharacterized protein
MSQRTDLEIVERLRAVAAERLAGADPAHDFAHVARVAASARAIAAAEGADRFVVEAAALLHELFNYPKDHPESARSGEICAVEALAVLRREGVDEPRAQAVAECIRVHAFSRGILPQSLEGRVLQDADRLDAIGAVGVARCFATGAVMRAAFYAPSDPFCERRAPDDKRFSVDHFYRKLLKLGDGLHTATARTLADERIRFMRQFLEQLAREIGAGG